VSAASERGGHRGSVDLGDARAHDAEDTRVHLHEAYERAGVREVDDLVREVGDAVHVPGPGDRGDEHLETARRVRLEGGDERVEQGALLLRERRAQVLRDHVLARPVPQAPGERLGVAPADARVAERAGVLVDPEREHGSLERRGLELPLGEDADERRRERGVLRQHEVLGLHPVGRLPGVVVEDDDLDGRVARDALELPEPLGMDGLDDDETADRVEVDATRLDEVELVRVQAVELAHVAVQRAREGDDRAGIEPPGGEHRGERVEVGVRVGDDHVHG
jgi:hypothetical protein